MTPAEYSYLSDMLKSRTGLILSADKTYLLESRLMPIVRERRLKDLAGLVATLRAGNQQLAMEVADAMTTNETFFFRDTKPFDTFRRTVLPSLLSSRSSARSFRVWCAAASTGQEPYSLAMILNEESEKLQGWRYEIVATDISARALRKASAGVYSEFEVQRGMPAPYLAKYFDKEGCGWRIRPDIRSMINFREHNLLKDAGHLGHFDIVFCRNVLIYFDRETKIRTLHAIHKMMAPGGFLFLGGTETIVGLSEEFNFVPGHTGIYVRGEAGGASAPVARASAAG